MLIAALLLIGCPAKPTDKPAPTPTPVPAGLENTDWPQLLVEPKVREVPKVAPSTPIKGKPGGSVILLGLDGADWQVLGPLLEKGRMPNLEKIMAAGGSGFFQTDIGFSPVSWTTIATGADMNVHGIKDDTPMDPQISSRIKVPPIWEIALSEGKSVGVVQVYFGEGLPLANGDYFGRLKWPENEIELDNSPLDESEIQGLPVHWRELNHSDIKAALAVKHTPGLFFTIISSMDTVCHYNLHGFAAMRPGWKPAYEFAQLLKRKNDNVLDTATQLDEVLGYVWNNMPKGSTLVLLSDHGVGYIRFEFRIEPSWVLYEELGIDGIREGRQTLNIDGREFETMLEFERISMPLLSVEGTEMPLVIFSGVIEVQRPDTMDAQSFRDWAASLGQKLSAAGPQPLQARLSIEGDKLIIKPNDPTSAVLFAQPHQEPAAWERKPQMPAQHGSDNPGIIVVAGPGVIPGNVIQGAKLEDAAPTMLYAMGLAPSDGMTGRLLTDLYSEEYLQKYPPKQPVRYSRPQLKPPKDLDPDVIERLRSLGYLN